MLEYFEIPPPPALADTVECFWVSKQSSCAPYVQLVCPDGCADLLFTRDCDGSTLHFVGPMTTFARFTIPSGQLSVAVRFHPGCWTHLVRTDADLLTDCILPFESFLPEQGRRLREQLINEFEPLRMAHTIAAVIKPGPRCRVSSALSHLQRTSQYVGLDQLALQAGLSTRQLRRQVRELTGLSPKLLARILRFRRAAMRLHTGRESHAAIAADSGYFDQSHFIAEYRHFTGQTPAATTATRLASARPPTRSPVVLR